MNAQEIKSFFNEAVKRDKNVSEALHAVDTLMQFIKVNKNTTLRGLNEDLKTAIDILSKIDKKVTSVSSACDMFLKYISLTTEIDTTSFDDCKEILLKRGRDFLNKKIQAKDKIAEIAETTYLRGKVLVHSYSRVVLHVLKAWKKRKITVYVTESRPDYSGIKMYEEIKAEGIKTILILDSAVGYIMSKVDMVLIGAEMVCQNGGIINKIGSNSIAMCASCLNKPVYVAAESFKFSREFPLSTKSVPEHYAFPILRQNPNADTTNEHPRVDYVPPKFIDTIMSDLGLLHPEAVCDVSLNLYI